MKRIDILLVRFLPFILFVIFGINMCGCYCGFDMTLSYELHGNSALYAIALFLISLSNKIYHCVWNRAMYMFLVIIPILNFLDSAFYFIPSDRVYMSIILVSYSLVAITTSILAIRHFIQVSKRRMNHGRE